MTAIEAYLQIIQCEYEYGITYATVNISVLENEDIISAIILELKNMRKDLGNRYELIRRDQIKFESLTIIG